MLTASTDKSIDLSRSDCLTLLNYDTGLLSGGGDLGDLLPVSKITVSRVKQALKQDKPGQIYPLGFE